MRMLATVTKPSSGTIRFDGDDVANLRTAAQDSRLSTAGLRHLSASLGDRVPRIHRRAQRHPASRTARAYRQLLEIVNLTHAASRPLGGFSGGMRQRVGIAQALLNDPRVLIVDEPTAGLDPEERVRLRTLLHEMAGDRIIVFSTHICSDVESVATRIAIVNHGTLLAEGLPSELLLGRSESLEDAYLRIVAGHTRGMSRLWPIYALVRADLLERTRRYQYVATIVVTLLLGTLLFLAQRRIRNVPDRRLSRHLQLGVGRRELRASRVDAALALRVLLRQERGRARPQDARRRDHRDDFGRPFRLYARQGAEQLSRLGVHVGDSLRRAVAMQFVRGESTAINLAQIAAPFALVVLPMIAIVARIALLFEMIPWLRGGSATSSTSSCGRGIWSGAFRRSAPCRGGEICSALISWSVKSGPRSPRRSARIAELSRDRRRWRQRASLLHLYRVSLDRKRRGRPSDLVCRRARRRRLRRAALRSLRQARAQHRTRQTQRRGGAVASRQ